MKNKIIVTLVVALTAVSLMGCNVTTTKTYTETDADGNTTTTTTTTTNGETTTETSEAEFITYEFETFDGYTVMINEGTILSQEACEEPLEWEGLPADAEQIAPGRECILLQDAENYYVEDATNKLVTVAFRELGDVIEE